MGQGVRRKTLDPASLDVRTGSSFLGGGEEEVEGLGFRV